MNYLQKFKMSELTYADIAHELGCCELTARNKINGNTRITKAEEKVLNSIFDEKEDKSCTILRHSR